MAVLTLLTAFAVMGAYLYLLALVRTPRPPTTCGHCGGRVYRVGRNCRCRR